MGSSLDLNAIVYGCRFSANLDVLLAVFGKDYQRQYHPITYAEYFESFWKFFCSTYSSKYPELERTLLHCLTGIVEAEYSSDYECRDYYVYLGVDFRRVKLTEDSDTGDSRLTALIPKNIHEISCDFLVFLSKNFISHMELVKNHRSRDPLQVKYGIIPEREMKEILEKIDTCLVGRPKVTTLHFC